MTILKPLRAAVVASLLVGCAAPHQQHAQINAAQSALYAEVVDPVDHWPTQTQWDISLLESDYFTHYQQDYANGEVYADFPSLTECALPQERALEIAALSPEMINPPSKSATIESLSTVGYEQISVRSTPTGCQALSAVVMHTIPNMVVELKQLPDAFRHPVYIHAVYTNHIKNRVNINGSWKKATWASLALP